MKKSIIAFGILVSTVFSTVSANTNSGNRISKINETKISHISPMVLAIVKDDVAVVKSFIAYGADIEQVSNTGAEMTALMYAARYNQLDIVKILVAEGASTSKESKIGATALDYAKVSGATEVVGYLNSL
ncbi:MULTISPECIES: ankyrin repeat domain-containing protein [Maribacter]|uniref:ankyrin repeat domain-containing protein n=1 Tax=Maribacter TaxID=252356 RepID=UPI0005684C4F|nr:ankyrin repeat domain-containing protein [Maribacter forsetii]